MIQGFSEWVNEDDWNPIPMTDDELIEYINSEIEFYSGKIGKENILKLSHSIKNEEKLGKSSDLTERAFNVMSAYINVKHSILQTLFTIRREIYLRARDSDPTIDK